MRAQTSMAAGLLAIFLIVGCGGGSSAPNPDDEETKSRLLDARRALEIAATELEGDEFRRYENQVLAQYENQASKEEFEFDPTPPYFALISFFSENGDEVPSIVRSDLTDLDRVDITLSGIEFHEDPKSITMIAPPRLGNSPPSEVIEAGVMFAGISRSGQIFCLRPEVEDPEPCEPPPVEELVDDAARLRRLDRAKRLDDD